MIDWCRVIIVAVRGAFGNRTICYKDQIIWSQFDTLRCTSNRHLDLGGKLVITGAVDDEIVDSSFLMELNLMILQKFNHWENQ